jgi:hypothetical protein
MPGTELVPAEIGKGSRMGRIVSVIVPPVKSIVDDNHRPVVIAQRAPADIINSGIPVHPGRPPAPGRNPIPSQAASPMPAAVMGDTPSPRFIGTPCPSTDGIPDPSPVVVGFP